MIIFDSIVFFLKSNQTKKFFLKKLKPNWNRFKPTGFGSVFSGLARFFRFWLSFFSGLGSVRFGFFCFKLIKPKRTDGFLKILIGFFHGSILFYFFSNFLSFLIFFTYTVKNLTFFSWFWIVFEKRIKKSAMLLYLRRDLNKKIMLICKNSHQR